jgi:uncharacterized protein HemY
MERIGNQHGQATLHYNLGQLHREHGQVAQARAHYQQALALCEMVGDWQHAQMVAQELQRL